MINKLIVGVGDMSVSNKPDSLIVTYALGSCIGLAAYDPLVRAGGLIHIMLPNTTDALSIKRNPIMFIETGFPIFFEELYKLGAAKPRLIIKIAGGASLYSNNNMFNIGARNCEYTKRYLQENNMKLVAQSIGGTYARTMKLTLKNGKVWVKIPGLGSVELWKISKISKR